MISLQTNVTSLIAQQNLSIDNKFQSKTIEQLTSGFRINSSGDDAAGLAIANGYRSSIAELTQGMANANDGVSQLQIIDGGLSNISTILDRLKTLATQSASSTFTGSRITLNQEYSQLITEVNRQAANINLNSGGSYNSNLSVYIGGAITSANATVTVDLSGTASAVDATSLGLQTSNVLAGGVGIGGNTTRIDATGGTFVVGTPVTDDQTFSFNVFSNGNAQSVTARVAASAGGTSLASVLASLNGQLGKFGIVADTDNNGLLQFSGATPFTILDNGTLGAGTSLLTNAGAPVLPAVTSQAVNTSNYSVAGKPVYVGKVETLSFQTSSGATSVTFAATDTLASALSAINAKTSGLGVYAVANAAGTGISLQGANTFSVTTTAAAGAFTATGNQPVASPTTGNSNNGTAAITAINSAIQTLGLVQGKIGAGQNLLQYSISLAQSQVASFSAAQSQIRDADVAAQAANLTKAQVLTQTSVAALAQANTAPQSILKLLQG